MWIYVYIGYGPLPECQSPPELLTVFGGIPWVKTKELHVVKWTRLGRCKLLERHIENMDVGWCASKMHTFHKTNPTSSHNSSAKKICPLKASAGNLKIMVYKFRISSFFVWFPNFEVSQVVHFCRAPYTPSATPRTIGDAKVASASCTREANSSISSMWLVKSSPPKSIHLSTEQYHMFWWFSSTSSISSVYLGISPIWDAFFDRQFGVLRFSNSAFKNPKGSKNKHFIRLGMSLMQLLLKVISLLTFPVTGKNGHIRGIEHPNRKLHFRYWEWNHVKHEHLACVSGLVRTTIDFDTKCWFRDVVYTNHVVVPGGS